MELGHDCTFIKLLSGNPPAAPSVAGASFSNNTSSGTLPDDNYYEWYLVAYRDGQYSGMTYLADGVYPGTVSWSNLPAPAAGTVNYLVRGTEGYFEVVQQVTGTTASDNGGAALSTYPGTIIPVTIQRVTDMVGGYVIDSPNGDVRFNSITLNSLYISSGNITSLNSTIVSTQNLSSTKSHSGSSNTTQWTSYTYDYLTGTAFPTVWTHYGYKYGSSTGQAKIWSFLLGGSIKSTMYSDGRLYVDRLAVGADAFETNYKATVAAGTGGSYGTGAMIVKSRLDVGNTAGSHSDWRGGAMGVFKANSGSSTTISVFAPGGSQYVSMYVNDNGDYAVGPFGGNNYGESVTVQGRPGTSYFNGRYVFAGQKGYNGSVYPGIKIEKQTDGTLAPLTHNLLEFISQGNGWLAGDTATFGGIGYNGEFFVGGNNPSSCNGYFDQNGYLVAKRGTFSQRAAFGVVSLTDATVIATDASLGNEFRVTIGASRTMGAPSNPIDGQVITYRIKYSGAYGITWNTVFRFPGGTAPTLTSTNGKADYIVFKYVAVDSKWDQVGERMNY